MKEIYLRKIDPVLRRMIAKDLFESFSEEIDTYFRKDLGVEIPGKDIENYLALKIQSLDLNWQEKDKLVHARKLIFSDKAYYRSRSYRRVISCGWGSDLTDIQNIEMPCCLSFQEQFPLSRSWTRFQVSMSQILWTIKLFTMKDTS